MIFVVACSEEGDYYDGFKVDNSVKEDGDPIPSGGEYTKKATKAVYTSGQNTPEKAAMGDTYKYGDYTYTMRKDGWSVALSEGTDKAKEAYGEITVEDDGEVDPAPADDDEYADMASAIREGVNGI